MSRSTRSGARRAATTAIALCISLSAALTASVVSAGSAGAGKAEKVDKNAVLRFGVPFEDQGGAFFDPSSPRATANPTPRLWMDLIYGTMIVQTEDGKGKPGLATKATAVNPNTVEITLREGVKFSDGTPFNADAVKAAWDRLIASNRPFKFSDIQAMKSVDKVDDKTVRVNLSQPVALDFVNDSLKNSAALGVPSPTAAAAGNLDTKPVGAGPYALESYQTGKVVLSRNSQYYDKAAQKLAGYELTDVAIGPPGVSALQAGTVDAIWQFPPDAIAALKATNGIDVHGSPSLRQYQVGLCATQGVFANKQARQAIQYAVDRDAINEAVLESTSAPNQTVLAPTHPYFNKSLAKTYDYSPKKAKALLKKAGVAPGTKVRMLVPSQPPFPALADVLQSQLDAVGLDGEITLTTNYASDAINTKPDMWTITMDPTLFGLYWDTQSPPNPCGYHSDALVTAVAATKDPAKTGPELQAAFDTLQKAALDESVNIVTNVFGLLVANNEKVKGLTIVNSPYGPQLGDAYIVKG
jgi:ABC-type transport system substrate-binding protein